MAPETFDPAYLEGARYLHLTGITPALSVGCRDFVGWAAREARRTGVKTSLDVNYRSKLWRPEEARGFVEEVLPEVDLLFVGDEEARALWNEDGSALARDLSSAGPREVVVKRGAEGAAAFVGGNAFEHAGFEAVEVDPIGAGDAFDAGYLAGSIWGLGPADRLRVADALGAACVATIGDYEGLPDRGELEAFLDGEQRLGR